MNRPSVQRPAFARSLFKNIHLFSKNLGPNSTFPELLSKLAVSDRDLFNEVRVLAEIHFGPQSFFSDFLKLMKVSHFELMRSA
jgi:hypothetical protein